jgi:2-keto-4-pentenoate hydratase/2-oxohepta-3-ene-1,7-dioic acid hydratase in catechol pathway
LLATSAVVWPARAQEVSNAPDTPFKLATFSVAGKEAVGMLLGERRLVEIGAAGEHLVSSAGVGALRMPGTMLEVIEDYERIKTRLYQIANYFGAESGRPFIHDLAAVKIEAPIQYPANLIAAALNYREHGAEMGNQLQVDPERDAPFLFAKSPRSSIIATGETYFIPPGETSIDWEGEFAVVIGRPCLRVDLQGAMDCVFGYTIVYDVSDRSPPPRAHPAFAGPDWFSAKSLDRGAPMGPFIVPKEFIANHADLRIVTRLNDRVVQDGNTGRLIYDPAHLIRYISSVMTLYPGDVIATGTPDGVGAARQPPEFVKPGDVVSIEIEGVGTLVTPIGAAHP